MLYHDARCSLTLLYTLRTKMLLKMMLIILTCDRLSRGFCTYTQHICVWCMLLYAISSFLCLYTRRRLLLSAAVVVDVLMCIKRSMSMQLCIISACHKSKAHATYKPPYPCIILYM